MALSQLHYTTVEINLMYFLAITVILLPHIYLSMQSPHRFIICTLSSLCLLALKRAYCDQVQPLFIYYIFRNQSLMPNHICALHIMECTQTDKVAIANGEAPTLVGASSASNFV